MDNDYKAGKAFSEHISDAYKEDLQEHLETLRSSLLHLQTNNIENVDESLNALSDFVVSSNLLLDNVEPFLSGIPLFGDFAVGVLGEVPLVRVLISIQKNNQLQELEDRFDILNNKISNLETNNILLKGKIRKAQRELNGIKEILPQIQKQVNKNTKNIKIHRISLIIAFILIVLGLFQIININSRLIPDKKRGPNNEYSESGLAQRVEKALKEDSSLIGVGNVYIAQRDNVIILRGSVPNYNLIKSIEKIVLKVKGVKKVDSSELIVR